MHWRREPVGELILFLEEKIADLTERRKEAELEEDWLTHDYLEGAIDAYDIVRMKLTNPA
jgi:hypothetical protein